MHAFPESQGERVLSQLAEQTNELLPLNEQEIQMLAFSDFVLKQVLAHPRFYLKFALDHHKPMNGKVMHHG